MNERTKVQCEASGWSLDTDLKPLTPMVDPEPVPRWWRWTEAQLDLEPFYEWQGEGR